MRSTLPFRTGALRRSCRCLCGAAAVAKPPMSEKEKQLLHQLKTRDVSLVVPNMEGTIRLTFIQNRGILRDTIQKHDLIKHFLPALLTASDGGGDAAAVTRAIASSLELVGTNLTFLNMLAAQLEKEERIEMRYTAGKFIILSESMALGETRCYLKPAEDLADMTVVEAATGGEDDEEQLSLFLQRLQEGHGANQDMLEDDFRLKVDKVLYNQKKKFVSLMKSNFASLLCSPEEAASVTEAEVPLGLQLLPPLDVLLRPDTLEPATRRKLYQLFHYYHNNMTLHAYNYFRSSDGVVAAVWCETLLNEKDGRLTEDVADGGAVSESCGLLLTPLAAGSHAERHVYNVQQRLVQLAAEQPDGTRDRRATHGSSNVLLRLLHKAELQQGRQPCSKYLTQEVLSFFTGDYEGAALAAQKARHFTNTDLGEVERKIAPLRRLVWGEDHHASGAFDMKLNAAEAKRCSLDFFCRCSKFDILNSFITLPEAVFQEVMGEQVALHKSNSADEGIRCIYCGKRHVIAEKEWQKLKNYRDEQRGKN